MGVEDTAVRLLMYQQMKEKAAQEDLVKMVQANRIKRLGKALMERGDFSPQGLMNFAQAEGVAPDEMEPLVKMIAQFKALNAQQSDKFNYAPGMGIYSENEGTIKTPAPKKFDPVKMYKQGQEGIESVDATSPDDMQSLMQQGFNRGDFKPSATQGPLSGVGKLLSDMQKFPDQTSLFQKALNKETTYAPEGYKGTTMFKLMPNGDKKTVSPRSSAEEQEYRRQGYEYGNLDRAPSATDVKPRDYLSDSMRLMGVNDMNVADEMTQLQITNVADKARQYAENGMPYTQAIQQAHRDIVGKSQTKNLPASAWGSSDETKAIQEITRLKELGVPQADVQKELKMKGFDDAEIKRIMDKSFGASGNYQTKEDVKQAVKTGKLSRDAAIKILQDQFGMQ